MADTVKPNLIKAADIRAAECQFSHPWNPNSQLFGNQLGPLVGLQRTGVNLGRIPPGKESFVYHLHYQEEESLNIISGKGIAEIDGKEYEVGPGDFMGFLAPSVAHHLRNPFSEDLVYLAGGEHRERWTSPTFLSSASGCCGSAIKSRLSICRTPPSSVH